VVWDSSRTVPWRRLVREWLLYVGIMAAVFVIVFRDQPLLGIFAGLLISGPLYLAFGYVMAKFGYQRKSLKQMRAESSAERDDPNDQDAAGEDARPRPKPAPTSRTGGGSQRPASKSKRRR
jgi:hypothetical protein